MKLKNILFDFGGVICNIDISKTEKAFRELGMNQFNHDYSVTERDQFFGQFETGMISPEQFRETLKPFFHDQITDTQIDDAWNALLLEMPPKRIELLKSLRSEYQTFLLSNTNQIHYKKYLADLQVLYGYNHFEDLFDKAYFSHQIGKRKPFPETFQFVCSDAGIREAETLFIDDSPEPIEGARKAGLYAHPLGRHEELTDLFTPEWRFRGVILSPYSTP